MDSGIKIDHKVFHSKNTLGIYVHIPFCQSKCFYCDFNTYANIDHQIDDYIKSLLSEISIWSKILKGSSIKSIFFWWWNSIVHKSKIYRKNFKLYQKKFHI